MTLLRRAALAALIVFLMLAELVNGAAGLSRHDVEYGRAGDYSLRMDMHTPPGRGPFPAVIIVHGGGWVTGDRQLNVEPLFRPVEDAGFAWFSISYRFANDVFVFGAAIQDVEQAVQHVRAHAADYNIDPRHIALIGESAGAQLASMAALAPELKGAVCGVVALYSPSDLVSLAKTSPHIPPAIRNAVEGTPWADFFIAGLRRLSPLYNVRPDMPPFLLIHGTADTLVPFEQSTRMCEQMHQAGAACELYPVKGGEHGVRWWESDHLTAYKQVMIRWLEARFGAAKPAHA